MRTFQLDLPLCMQVLSQEAEQGMIEAPDGAPIQVRYEAGSQYDSSVVEVVGHVTQDDSGR